MLRALVASIGYGAAMQRLRDVARQNLRRALLLACAAICLLIAAGFLTGWGWVTIATQFGSAAANLAIAGIYALIACALWVAGRPEDSAASDDETPRPLIVPSAALGDTAPAGGTALGAVGLLAVTGFVLARLMRREFQDRT